MIQWLSFFISVLALLVSAAAFVATDMTIRKVRRQNETTIRELQHRGKHE